MKAYGYFVTSAVFHYLGPAFAVLLFARVEPLGVAWLRIAVAAVIFAAWRRPWRAGRRGGFTRVDIALGLTLAAMNCVFYLAIARLPLATVGAIEFLGPIALAALGLRGLRNVAALGLAACGVLLLTRVNLEGDAFGFLLAFANCGLFALYIILSKKVGGIDGLARAMMVAAVVGLPIGFADATTAFADPRLLAAAVAVGVCSSVIPYVCDQLALARMSRATFALMLSLLPATATIIGLVVLAQIPTTIELAGIALVIVGVAVKSERNKSHAIRPVRTVRPEGFADLPGHDELRRPVGTGVASR